MTYPYTEEQIYSALATRRRDAWKRTKKNGKKMEFDIEVSYLEDLYYEQKGKCAISGVPLRFERGTNSEKNPESCSIDRIDSKKGYVVGNIQLLTHFWNNAKSTFGMETVNKQISYIKRK